MINLNRFRDLLDDKNNLLKNTGLPGLMMGDQSAAAQEQTTQNNFGKDKDPFVNFRSCVIDELKLKVMAEP